MTSDPDESEVGADLAPLGDISRWADAMSEAIAERNRAIRSAVAAGHSQRAVARAAGLTHPAVAKILAKDRSDD